MNDSTRRLLRQLASAGDEASRKAAQAIERAYRGQQDGATALIEELRRVMALRNPTERLKARERLIQQALSLHPPIPPPFLTQVTESVTVGGQVAAGMVSVSMEIVSPAVLEAAAGTEAMYRAFWGDQRADHAARLGRVITQALSSGGSKYPVKAEIMQALGVSRSKAVQLGHDAIQSALNAGQVSVWDKAREDLGLELTKTWLHARGGKNSRPDHVALDGKTIPYSEDFIPGLPFPHSPGAGARHNANCRCSVYVTLQAD